MAIFLKIFITIFLLYSSHLRADICDDWFIKSKIKKNKNCLNSCVIHKVDLSTFVCHSICNKLCDSDIAPDFIFTLSSLYPGLTDSERALTSQLPKEAFIVYKQKAKAETACEEIFGTNNKNDESDSCRHFIWSAYLTRELGSDLAQKFLNAHEEESTQPENEKAMDLANNRVGFLLAEKLIKSKKFSNDIVIKEFHTALKNNELTILKPTIKK